MIPIWKEKIRYDAVRPLTAIRFIYGTKPVTSWGGPGKGTVENLPTNEWRSYLGDADHPGMMFISNKSYLCILHVHYITLHYITLHYITLLYKVRTLENIKKTMNYQIYLFVAA